MASSELQRLLSELKSPIVGGASNNGNDTEGVVNNLERLCLEDIRDDEKNYCCSLLFNKDSGVINFLRSTATKDEFKKSKIRLLEMLLRFTINNKHITPYLVDIKDVCITLFTREKYNTIKEPTMPLLIEILTQSAGTVAADDMKIPKLIEKFFGELAKPPSTHSPSVKQHIYHLLGVFCDVYPDLMVNYSDRLISIYAHILKTESGKPKTDAMTSGVLRGLAGYLSNFTQSITEGSVHAPVIFRCVCTLLSPARDYTRYAVPVAALQLLHKHAAQFSLLLLDDHQNIHNLLYEWGTHKNKDMRHAGMLALEAVYKVISELMVERHKQGIQEGAAFKFFIHIFRTIMDNPASTSKEVSLAVRGYGYFAAPCKMFLSANDVRFMFNEMIQKSEQIFIREADSSSMISLPSFLDALSSILLQLDDPVSTLSANITLLTYVERLVVLLMEQIPYLHEKLHHGCYLAIVRILLAVKTVQGSQFNTFLQHIVYQALIRMCSHPVQVTADEATPTSNNPTQAPPSLATNQDSDEITDFTTGYQMGRRVTYQDYIALWNNLLEASKFKTLSQSGISISQTSELSVCVYDEIIHAILTITNKLDLSTKDEDPDDASTTDPLKNLTPTTPKDFIVFVNMVEFCRDVLRVKRTDLFQRWVFNFGHRLIIEATKKPLVSGFYKLLAVCMEICDSTQYFKILGREDAGSDSMEFDIPEVERSQIEATFVLFAKFTKEVLGRMKQYKDELLVACLTFILALPCEIVKTEIKNISTALQMSLRLGQSYLSLAMMTLEALERWSKTLPSHILRPFYREILPCLDAFLATPSGLESQETISMKSSGVSKKSGRKKIPIKVLRTTKKENKTMKTDLEIVKQKCVTLLGDLGGEVNQMLILNDQQMIAECATAWDTQQHLKFDMPFIDIKPTIYLDPFLPYVVELSTTSSDRQTKIAACELLHSLVLYMLGRSVSGPAARRGQGASQGAPVTALYKKVFPAILTLACDADQVCRQLFEPLMFQLIHWFTGNKKYESEDTMMLLNALMDAIVNPTDTALRDLSAKCLKEFLKWSIKQTTPKMMEASPINVKSILKRIYSLASHPSSFNRLGAAVAFNNIYDVMREENSLVDRFVLNILVIFTESLALAHNDEDSIGTRVQCTKALHHLERIIKHKADILNKPSKHRELPRGWMKADLDVAVRWLLRQCGRPQTECRHTCMQLVFTLSPAINTIKSAKDFFQLFLKEKGPMYYVQRFEKSMYNLAAQAGLYRFPKIYKISERFSVPSAITWFNTTLATLDCYTMVFSAGLMLPHEVLVVSDERSTVVYTVLEHIISDIALDDIDKVAELFQKVDGRSARVFTPKEVEDYNRSKCTVFVRIFNFLVQLLKNPGPQKKAGPSSLWSKPLFEFLVTCTLCPSAVGFNMADVEVIEQLPHEIEPLLQLINRVLPPAVSKKLTDVICENLESKRKYDLLHQLQSVVSGSDCDVIMVEQLISGYLQLYRGGCLKNIPSMRQLPENLLQTVYNAVVVKSGKKMHLATLTPAVIALCNKILELAFSMESTGGMCDSLLIQITDASTIHSLGGATSLQHGSTFFSMFQQPITCYLGSNIKSLLSPYWLKEEKSLLIGSVILSIVDHVGRDRQLRTKIGPVIVKEILHHWKSFLHLWTSTATDEQKLTILSLLSKLMIIDSKIIIDSTQPHFAIVYDMYTGLISESKTTLTFKTKVLDLLPFFATISEDKQLKRALNRLISDHFPMKSTEFAVKSPKYNDYIAALDKILMALELSGSLMLLETLISILCREESHIYEEEMQKSLVKFIKRLPRDQHKRAADVAYEIFMNGDDYTNTIRRATLEKVALSLLRNVHSGAIGEFYRSHIVDIMKVIESKTIKSDDNQLMSKLCCFQLIEMLYSRLSKDLLNTKNSSINSAYCNNDAKTGKEMTMAITKAANSAKGEDIRGDDVNAELHRQYHCAAYNTLIAVICTTQTELKFYQAFLFTENLNKGQLLFDNLIDTEKVYDFPMETETPLARRKRFVSIRSKARSQRHASGSSGTSYDYEGSNYTTSVHYLASGYLNDSSLSTEVTQFDSAASIHQSVTSTFSSSSDSSKVTLEDKTEDDITTEHLVEFEADELNQHECMASLTALLKHMQEQKITVIPNTDSGSQLEMLAWMKYLHTKLSSNSTGYNTKLFIARLIINAEEVFRPFARFWLSPLVHLLVCTHRGSATFNYFMVDIIVTLLSWHNVAIPEDTNVDRAMASQLVSFTMEFCSHESRQVFKNNLEVIKTLVEVWKDRITVPTSVIYNNLKPDPGNEKRTSVGIQLLGVVLANKLEPYNTDSGIAKDSFYKILAGNLQGRMKEVYAAAAEVVGMALKHLDKDNNGDEWLNGYTEYIVRILTDIQNKKQDQFIICVHKMQQYYPKIAKRFLQQIIFHMPRLYGEFRMFCLEIITAHVGDIENVFLEMKNKNIIGILQHRDDQTQGAALKLIEAMLPYLTKAELLSVLPSVKSLSESNNSTTRNTMYGIFMTIYDQYRDDSTEDVHQILCTTKNALLRGLSDEDLHIKLRVQNFWTDGSRLPVDTFDRMVAMLEAMYSPDTERDYLTYASNFLLEMTSKSPDYNRSMFEHPLSECTFRNYSVSSSWKQRHAMMTPLFVESQSMSTSVLDESMDDDNQLRATQQVQQFTPTQTGGSNAPFNWLTQSSLDTFNDQGLTQTLETQTQSSSSSLLFKRAPTKMATKEKSGAKGLYRPTQQTGNKDVGHQAEMLRLRRRFVKDQERTRIYFIKHQQRLAKAREDVRREQKQKREHQVTMYRQYRIGDLPDIQISYSHIIAPLQALAQRNGNVARLLYGGVFKAIFGILDTIQMERDAKETTEKISECLNQMLKNSDDFNPTFIAWIVDIAYAFPKRIKLEAGSLNNACVSSLQQPLGILLLEEMLIQGTGEEAPPTKKRARMERREIPPETTSWIELARLYKSVNDYDVLQGIFGNHIGTQKLTRQAMEAEMRSDFNSAQKYYNEALATEAWPDGNNPDEVEVDFWELSRLHCYNNLSSWKELDQIICDSIDEDHDLMKVWEDTYAQENYLPHLIRGKLKLILEDHSEDEVQQKSLGEFLDKSREIEDRKCALESNHSEELALLHIVQEDYPNAEYYTNLAIQAFLQNWSDLGKLMLSSRKSTLQKLQKLTEIQEFLKFLSKNECSMARCTNLIERWFKRCPDMLSDSCAIWEDLTANRCLFIGQLEDLMNRDSEADFKEHEIKFRLHQINAAKEQGNLQLALRLLKHTRKSVYNREDDSLLVNWTHCYATTHQKRCLVGDMEPKHRVAKLMESLKTLDGISKRKSLTNDILLSSEHCEIYGRSLELMNSVLRTDLGSLNELEITTKESLTSFCDDTKDYQKLMRHLVLQAYNSYTSAVSSVQSVSESNKVAHTKRQTDAHIALLRYCDRILHDVENDDDKSLTSDPHVYKQFPVTVIESLVYAIKQGSLEACQRFPRLLQIVEYYPKTMELFIRKVDELPCWMYVSWIAQITAILDKPESPAVQNILIKLVNSYPQAVAYPFKMSDDGYKFTDDAIGKKAKSVRDRIVEVLSKNRLLNAFVSALEQFGQPNHIFKDWFDGIGKLLHGLTQHRDKTAIKQHYLEFHRDFIDLRSESEDDLYDTVDDRESVASIVPGMGKYRQKFSKHFAKQIISLCGKDGINLTNITYKEFHKKGQAIIRDMDNKAGTSMKPPNSLKEYSQWLADFKTHTEAEVLEIPGQYMGFAKPMPEYHAKISSFDERVSVMSSIRKPKTLIIHGNDWKDYKFLVKGGEDLRQDQRIEQLFALMKQVFNEDVACRQRQLQLRTYQVIPMTPRVGLIEWMSHTIPLKEFLKGACEKEWGRPSHQYNEWIGGEPQGPHQPRYMAMYKKYSRADTITAFKRLEAMVPWNLMRQAYHQMSASLEAYFTLRTNMATTHAVICICQYLLGIGDRHLSNFMIDLQTGAMVGIDFGHAFGSATEFLPVPELMPFRLTRQIRNLLLPLREKGTLECTMIHALRALRNNKDLLLTTMDVFIKEPSLDWKQNAQRQIKAMQSRTGGSQTPSSQASSDRDELWFPKQKVEFAKRKLLGYNPCVITRDELTLAGPSKQQLFKYLLQVLSGDKNHDIRAQLPASGLTVEQQVACLLNQATDPNILGRVYAGWEPWV